MKLIVPKYYKDFKCLGGICSDNCCIGWEIDIDEKTLEKYSKEGGELGENLRKTIVEEDGTSQFALCGERCPHLNSENLCNLMIAKGHDYLCEICREHPRYYTVLGDIVFGGVGLSCEAAAELILNCESPTDFITLDTSGNAEECDGELLETVLRLREEIFKIFVRPPQTIIYTINETVRLAEEAQKEIDGEPINHCDTTENLNFSDLFSKMEFMSDELPNLLVTVKQINRIFENESVNKYLHNIFAYFLHRYLPKAAEDGYILGKVFVASASTMAIFHLFSLEEKLTLSRAIYLSKLYSKEVEYNEENIQKLEEKATLSVF